MPRAAVRHLIGWTLRVRGIAKIPAPLAGPAKAAPTPSRLRAASAEGPPSWQYIVGRFPNGARARSFGPSTTAAARAVAPRIPTRSL
jgi:hypothetical protein